VLRLLLFLAGLCAYADSIRVEIAADRHATVQEHYSLSGPTDFVFLVSPCARVEKIQAGGRPLEISGSGPWITVAIPPMREIDLSYDVMPTAPPRACAVPILMPKHPINSVSLTVAELGSGLARISAPHLLHSDFKTWTATFPAVPSHLDLEWETGSAPPPSIAAPTGLFAWNFWGLAGVLVIWTIAYLLWARRQAF